MEQLITISTVGFIISTITAVVGVALSAITFWKYNIREVFMIRSGRGLKNALLGMEKQRAETGTLRNAPPEEPVGKKSKQRSRASDKSQMKAPETVPLNAAAETVSLNSAPETVQLRTAPETMALDAGSGSPQARSDDIELTGERADFDLISVEMETHTDEEIRSDSET